MKKLLIALTALSLVAITIVTMTTQDSMIQALAGSEAPLQVIRMILVGLLVALLLTSPPRSVYFRSVLAVGSLVLLAGSTVLFLDYQMLLLDALIFIELAIIFAIDALESPKAATIQKNPAPIKRRGSLKPSASKN